MSAITIDEDLVHYEVLGRGRPIILLHTWIGSWRYWIPLMRQLQMRYRVYAIDLFGFGDSSKNRQRYSIPKQIDLIHNFMNQLGVAKVALIAHGLGAQVALEFTRRHTDRVARILVTGAPLFDPGNLATRTPAGQRVLLTPGTPQLDLSKLGLGVLSAETQPTASSLPPPQTPSSPPAGNTPADTTASKPPAKPETPPTAANPSDRLSNPASSPVATPLRNQAVTIATIPPMETIDNPLRLALAGGMRNLLPRCFKHSEPEFERFQADIAKADDTVLFETSEGFNASEFLDIIRSLKLPTVIVHGEEDPIIPNPTDDVWNYLTIGNEELLLPVPLPGVRHFPMIEHEPFQRLVGLFLETPDVSKIEIKHRWRRRSR